MELEGSITISRNSNDEVAIEFRDELSRVRFVKARMGLEEFSQALFGLSGIEVTLEVRGLELVGLKRENQEYSFPMPENMTGNRKEVAKQELTRRLLAYNEEHGTDWVPWGGFDSQNSFFYGAEHSLWARTTIIRYVKIPDADQDL